MMNNETKFKRFNPEEIDEEIKKSNNESFFDEDDDISMSPEALNDL